MAMTGTNAKTGDRVVLHSLRSNPELNQKFGRIVAEDAEKFTVGMEAGGAFRTIRIKKEKVTKAQLALMHWGDSDPGHFFNKWESEIQKMDPDWRTLIRHHAFPILPGCASNGGDALLADVFPNNVYRYLFAKICHVVNTKKKIGEVGWAFRHAKPRDYLCGVVWADGSPDQSAPLVALRAGETWWPCIFLKDACSLADPTQRPFYCPALAWMNARPWPVHVDRVRTVETPGPVIEEIPPEIHDDPDDLTILD